MPLTKVNIVSLALNKIGKASINSIGNSEIDIAAGQLYDFLLEAELTSGAWRFAARISQMNLTIFTPTVPRWTYIYQLPADYAKLIRLHPHTYDFEIFEGGMLYTNIQSPLSVEYVSTNIQDVELPAYFCNFFINEIAAWLAASSAQNPQLTSLIQQDAINLRSMALALDAQNRPSQGIMSAPIITSREGFGIGERGEFGAWE